MSRVDTTAFDLGGSLWLGGLTCICVCGALKGWTGKQPYPKVDGRSCDAVVQDVGAVVRG